jgi:hypothetical protein
MSLAAYSSIADSAIIAWMSCVGEDAAAQPAVERALRQHLERDLGVADPAHAMRQTRRAEPCLAQPMALPAAAHDRTIRHPHPLEAELAVPAIVSMSRTMVKPGVSVGTTKAVLRAWRG